MINIEVLYEEYANLYGDRGNIKYIEKVTKNVNIIHTSLKEKPKFLTEKIDLVYLGPTTEKQQETIIETLSKYKNEIKQKIEEGQNILVTGNSIEIFGTHIVNTDGSLIETLDIFDVYAKRISRLRHNDLVMGNLVENNEIKIVGFKNQMSHLYGEDTNYFVKLEYGSGRDGKEKQEGIRYKGFIGTYILGPILALNPDFASYLFAKLNIEEEQGNIQEDAKKAYEFRIEEFNKFLKNEK